MNEKQPSFAKREDAITAFSDDVRLGKNMELMDDTVHGLWAPGELNLNKPFIPGYRFVNGKLYAFTKWSVLVVRGFPLPAAWIKTLKKPVFLGCRPTLDFRMMRLSASSVSRLPGQSAGPGKDESGKTNKKQEAYRKFWDDVPMGIKKILGRFRSQHWALFSFLCRCPGAAELLETNPAVGFALATNWIFHKPPVLRPLRAARSLLKRRRREICAWLGFPGTYSSVQVLAKVPARVVSEKALWYLRQAMWDRTAMKTLRHLPRINRSVIRIVSDPQLSQYVTGAFLAEIGLSRRDDRVPWDSYLLREALQGDALIGHGRRRFHHVKDLHKFFSDITMMTLGLSHEEACRDFPPPPLPGLEGALEPLTNPQMLILWSLDQRNCSGTAEYISRIISGEIYLYRLLAPRQATVSIVWNRERWVLGEIRGRCNSPVEASLHEEIREWVDIAQGLFDRTCSDITTRRES